MAMKRSFPRNRAAEIESMKDQLLCGLESVTWFSAWALLPVWLAFRDSSIEHFLAYSLASGTLLAIGVFADRGSVFEDVGHLLWFAGITCLAVLLFSGTMFALAHLFFWAAR